MRQRGLSTIRPNRGVAGGRRHDDDVSVLRSADFVAALGRFLSGHRLLGRLTCQHGARKRRARAGSGSAQQEHRRYAGTSNQVDVTDG